MAQTRKRTGALADVANSVACATCNHLASAHNDTADGANNGSCTMKGCDCATMARTGEGAPPKKGAKAAPAGASTGRATRLAPTPPAAPAAPADGAPADDAEAPASDPSEAIATTVAAVSAAAASVADEDLTAAPDDVQTFIGLVNAANAAAGVLSSATGDAVLSAAEALDAVIVAARNASGGLSDTSDGVTSAISSIHDADEASGQVLDALGAPDPDSSADGADDSDTVDDGDAVGGFSANGATFAPGPDGVPVAAPTPAVDAGSGDDNPGDLAGAVDAALDSALAMLEGVDVSTLPPNVQQAISLMRAADASVDDLLEAMGVADPDDDDTADASLVADASGQEGVPATDGDPDPAAPGGPSELQRFEMPVMVVEGVDTGDGRHISPGCLTWRDLPLPVMAITRTTMGHDDAELVGRLDTVERVDLSAEINSKTGEPYGEGVSGLRATGVFTSDSEAARISGLIADKFLRGVSVDISDVKSEIEFLDDNGEPIPADEGGDEDDFFFFLDGEIRETLTQGRVMGVTICPFPAFEGAYIRLDDGTETPQTSEVPEGVTASIPSIVNLDQFGARNCAPCENGAPIVASAGPLAPPMAWFEDPGFDGPTPLTITDDGRVYGHVATWGVCHTGVSNQCIMAPKSRTNYGYFRTGAVLTAEGKTVSTGPLTMGGGHAGLSLSASEAVAHYDEAGLAMADVAAGEDRWGIWVAGAMQPDVTPEQVRRFRASALSGDWRQVGGNLEMVAALAVNAPGFPVVRAQVASGAPQSLVAAGAKAVMLAAKKRADSDREMLEGMRAQWPMMQALLAERETKAARLRNSVKADRLRRAVHSKR